MEVAAPSCPAPAVGPPGGTDQRIVGFGFDLYISCPANIVAPPHIRPGVDISCTANLLGPADAPPTAARTNRKPNAAIPAT